MGCTLAAQASLLALSDVAAAQKNNCVQECLFVTQ
jgi:hypothetical protein